MTIAAFIAELEGSIDTIPPGSLRPETRFREMAWWDSLAALTTLAIFDSSFGRQLTGEQLAACETIQDIFQLSQTT